jgi:hypothetical protein
MSSLVARPRCRTLLFSKRRVCSYARCSVPRVIGPDQFGHRVGSSSTFVRGFTAGALPEGDIPLENAEAIGSRCAGRLDGGVIRQSWKGLRRILGDTLPGWRARAAPACNNRLDIFLLSRLRRYRTRTAAHLAARHEMLRQLGERYSRRQGYAFSKSKHLTCAKRRQ